jgi:D-alanyl-D-alanine carboxypeptidase
MQSLRFIATSVTLATVLMVNTASTVKAVSFTPNSDTNEYMYEIASRRDKGRPEKPLPPSLANKLQASLDKAVQDNGLPGATVKIITPQGIWLGASGVSSLETKMPMQPNDIFAVGSITKLFTAVTVVKLAEQGKLSLDDTLEKWLPEIASKITDGKTITIRQLLNGKAGIYDYTGNEKFQADYIAESQKQFSTGELKRWHPEELLEYAYGKPRFQGEGCFSETQWCYTNTSSILAGMIVEKATGSSFANVLREQVLNPLRLRHTFLSGDEPIVGKQARGYQDLFKTDGSFGQDGVVDDITEANFSAFWANGALFSNAPDLVQFGKALFSGKLLKEESLKEMLTFVDIGNNGSGTQFGLGVESLKLPFGRFWGKGGDHLGYQAYLQYFPDRGVTIATLVNRQYEIENPEKQFTSLTTPVYTAVLNTLQAETGGDRIDQARKLARVVGLTKHKPPQTDQEWQEFMAVWDD